MTTILDNVLFSLAAKQVSKSVGNYWRSYGQDYSDSQCVAWIICATM